MQNQVAPEKEAAPLSSTWRVKVDLAERSMEGDEMCLVTVTVTPKKIDSY